jgi:hypothetical protein
MPAHSHTLRHRFVTPALLAAGLLTAACRDGEPGSHALPAEPRLAAGAVSAARRASDLPFRGTVEAVETTVRDGGLLRKHLTGSGQAAHLGRYTAEYTFTIVIATLQASGVMVLTAANGDELRLSFTGQAVNNAGIVTIDELATITGGTGRFAGATGSFTQRRVLTQASGVSSGGFAGAISFAR